MKIITQQFEADNGLHVEKQYTNGEFTSICVQKKDGEVLFMGRTFEASDLLETITQILHEEVL